MDIDLRFPHRYLCEVLDELPGGSTRRYFFPPDRAQGQDGVLVQVRPESGEPWIGMFARGQFGSTGIRRVSSMPDPGVLCVVSSGEGYLVQSADPSAWQRVAATPVRDVRALPDAGLIVFANDTELVAYGAAGLKWRTRRVAWSGFQIVAVGDHTLIGAYRDPEDSLRQFQVDLETGEVRGGLEL